MCAHILRTYTRLPLSTKNLLMNAKASAIGTGGCCVFTFVRRPSDTNLRCFT